MPRADSSDTTIAAASIHHAARKEEEERKRIAAQEHFQRLYAEWLQLRARWGTGMEDAEIEAASTREADLAREIATTPSPASWTIWQKLDVLEHYMIAGGDGGPWTDQRTTTILGGIKADLLARGLG